MLPERAQAEVCESVLGRVVDGGGEQALPIDVRRVIPAPPGAVFATLLDFTGRPLQGLSERLRGPTTTGR